MSVILPVQAVPNQVFSVTLDQSVYDITLKTVGDFIAASIVRDGTTLFTSQRVVTGTPLIPYRYQEQGNFIFLTADDAFPFYEQFNVTQFLLYFTADELVTIRAST